MLLDVVTFFQKLWLFQSYIIKQLKETETFQPKVNDQKQPK